MSPPWLITSITSGHRAQGSLQQHTALLGSSLLLMYLPSQSTQCPRTPPLGPQSACWSGWVVVRSHHHQGQGAKWFLKTCPRCWFNTAAPPQDNPEHPFLLQAAAVESSAELSRIGPLCLRGSQGLKPDYIGNRTGLQQPVRASRHLREKQII